jgi:hypothetical protein
MRSISRSNGRQQCSFSTRAMSVSYSASRRFRAITETLDDAGLVTRDPHRKRFTIATKNRALCLRTMRVLRGVKSTLRSARRR